MPDIIFTAVVGGLPSSRLPLGGGATVLNGLVCEWSSDEELRLTILGTGTEAYATKSYPANVRYAQMPVQWRDGETSNSLTNLSTVRYARIARQFESATTEWLFSRAEQNDPRKTC